mmetsp:Transcript_17921/g.42418  ORF Transcript_17921/g.42418 Transcript_17921/m.42418 type:complete len:249 (-) Transcript_17921:701-1447(-)
MLEAPEIGAVLLLDDVAQLFFLGRGEVLEVGDLRTVVVFDPRVAQELHTLRVLHAEVLASRAVLQRLEGGLLADDLELVGEVLLDPLEDLHHKEVRHVQRLGVGLVDAHLEIKPDKLGQVPPRVRVLCPEHRSHLEDALEVAHDAHLLVELRGLRQARGLLEPGVLHVLKPEHVGASLARAGDDLRGVDLREAFLHQRRPEEVPHRRRDAEDGVLGGDAHVQHAVVQPDVGAHADVGAVDLARRELPF